MPLTPDRQLVILRALTPLRQQPPARAIAPDATEPDAAEAFADAAGCISMPSPRKMAFTTDREPLYAIVSIGIFAILKYRRFISSQAFEMLRLRRFFRYYAGIDAAEAV